MLAFLQSENFYFLNAIQTNLSAQLRISNWDQRAKIIAITATIFAALGLLLWCVCERCFESSTAPQAPIDSPPNSPKLVMDSPPPAEENKEPDAPPFVPIDNQPITIDLPLEVKLSSPKDLLNKAYRTLSEIDQLMGHQLMMGLQLAGIPPQFNWRRWTPSTIQNDSIGQLKSIQEDATVIYQLANDLDESLTAL